MKAIKWIWVGIIAVALLDLAAEGLWYLGISSGSLSSFHEWETRNGIEIKWYLFLAIFAFALITACIISTLKRRDKERRNQQ